MFSSRWYWVRKAIVMYRNGSKTSNSWFFSLNQRVVSALGGGTRYITPKWTWCSWPQIPHQSRSDSNSEDCSWWVLNEIQYFIISISTGFWRWSTVRHFSGSGGSKRERSEQGTSCFPEAFLLWRECRTKADSSDSRFFSTKDCSKRGSVEECSLLFEEDTKKPVTFFRPRLTQSVTICCCPTLSRDLFCRTRV